MLNQAPSNVRTAELVYGIDSGLLCGSLTCCVCCSGFFEISLQEMSAMKRMNIP
jgi:hypothetical protein